MKKIGITGQKGFIGSHLYNSLQLFPNEFECIPFEDVYFENVVRNSNNAYFMCNFKSNSCEKNS